MQCNVMGKSVMILISSNYELMMMEMMEMMEMMVMMMVMMVMMEMMG